MDMKQAVIRCLKEKYAEFGGRAGRSEFWYFMLAYLILNVVMGILHLGILSMLVYLALLVPSLAVGARRLHDIGKSGWLQLVGLIPVLGWILVIYWFAQPSTGPNEYGEGPAVPDVSAAVPPGAV